MKHQVIHIPNAAGSGFDITVTQTRPEPLMEGTPYLRVQYGSEVSGLLNYTGAAKELGECLLHACACAGRIAS